MGAEIERASKIVVDMKGPALKEGGGAGELVIPISKGIISESEIIELGEIITEKKRGRENNNEIIVFKSVGLAIEHSYLFHSHTSVCCRPM